MHFRDPPRTSLGDYVSNNIEQRKRISWRAVMITNQPLYTTYYTPGEILETPANAPPMAVQCPTYVQPAVSQITAPLFSLQAPAGNFTHSVRTMQPLSNFGPTSAIPTTYTGTSTLIPANTGVPFQQTSENTQLGNTNVSQLELTKRLLDNDREVQLKYADMESDKQKKLEDKAEKQRGKAATWKSRNITAMVHKHEKKATKLEIQAHAHYMKAEDYKAAAKELERQRKQYDPPQDKNDEKKQSNKKLEDKKATDKKEEKKSDKKKEEKNADGAKDENKHAVDTHKPEGEGIWRFSPSDAHGSSPTTYQNRGYPAPQQQQSPIGPNRPKQAVMLEKRDPSARYQQDVSTAALRYAKAREDFAASEQQTPQQQLATGFGRP